jgi:hypothetical protein
MEVTEIILAKASRKNPGDFCQMFVISKKKTIPYKNLHKVSSLAYGFLFFVISISELTLLASYINNAIRNRYRTGLFVQKRPFQGKW